MGGCELNRLVRLKAELSESEERERLARQQQWRQAQNVVAEWGVQRALRKQIQELEARLALYPIRNKTMTSKGTPLCGKWVARDRWGYKCERPAVEDGMCKPHAAGAKRKLANEAKYQETRRVEREKLDATRALIAKLAGLGVTASEHYSSLSGTYSGDVIVDPQQLIDLLLSPDRRTT